MIIQPLYFGVVAQLGDHPGLDVDPYFFTTPVAEWSLRHFFRTNDDHAPFTAGLIVINHRKSVDKAIRSYANAWISFLSGETGQLRMELSKLEATTDLASDVITSEERKLAQQKLRKRLGKLLALDVETEESGTTLGKRSRSQDGERSEGPSVKKNAYTDDPFLSQSQDNAHQEDDVVTIVQERGYIPLNLLFDYEAFEFNCTIGSYDTSVPFNEYYEEAVSVPYDHDAFQDFLATAGILFLGEEPTTTQDRIFGENYNSLREAMVEADEQDLEAEEELVVKFCQDARDLFRKTERKEGSEAARRKLKERVGQEEPSPLKELYEYAVKLPKQCTPVSEADQTSSFIMGMLRPIFDRPDVSCLTHSATTATSGSLFVRLCQNMISSGKNPDLLVRYKEIVDIGVAEVSYEASAQKDIGDLCRTALWSKRMLDEIVTAFENTEGVQLLFFQVVGQICNFYVMRRAGTVCVAAQLATIKIAYNLSDILTKFEDSARDWVVVCQTFDNLITTLKAAKPRKSDSPPPVFVGSALHAPDT
ncbi:hypothetical protein BGX34_003167 [Mortierella sp. NVP85]|nr:hypothetical protein BGX34_003167 [Mortierella sp. NVP85]